MKKKRERYKCVSHGMQKKRKQVVVLLRLAFYVFAFINFNSKI